MQVKNQQWKPDMEQQTHSKLGKEYVKAVYCHPAYITDTGLDEAQAGIKITGRNINNLRYTDATTLMAGSEGEFKSPLMKVRHFFAYNCLYSQSYVFSSNHIWMWARQ